MYNKEMERLFSERVQLKNQQNIVSSKQNQSKEVKDKLESKSNLYCNLMVVLCLISSAALVILAITEADRYNSSELLIWCYSISAIMCVVLCIWFRLLRYICKAILILLNNDCNRCNPEGNNRQQS
jgi:hypothetical protein